MLQGLQSWRYCCLWLCLRLQLLLHVAHGHCSSIFPAVQLHRPGSWVKRSGRRGEWCGPHCQQVFLPKATASTRHIKDLAATAGADAEFVRLDSVGGTTLYIRADAIRQGVNFPVRHVIGSQWDCEGFDGIETEGLCYMAEPLGYTCWAILDATVVHEGYHTARR